MVNEEHTAPYRGDCSLRAKTCWPHLHVPPPSLTPLLPPPTKLTLCSLALSLSLSLKDVWTAISVPTQTHTYQNPFRNSDINRHTYLHTHTHTNKHTHSPFQHLTFLNTHYSCDKFNTPAIYEPLL